MGATAQKTMNVAAATKTLEGMFDRIDALISQDNVVSEDELKKVFGESASEFLAFCDKDSDKKLTKDEFTSGILGNSEGMSQEEFDATWVQRMEGVVKSAEKRKAERTAVLQSDLSAVKEQYTEQNGKDAGTLVYFAGLRSRGEPCRMIAAYGGISMKDELLTFEQWGERKSEAIPFMPYIVQPDGSNLFETEDVLKHLAVMGGRFVVDDKTAELCHRANNPPLFIADPYLNMPEEAWAGFGLPSKAEWISMVIPELKKLATELGDAPFFAGEKPGYGEAFIWHNIENAVLAAKDEISAGVGEEVMAKLMGFHGRFAELPGIKEYLAARPKQFGAPGSLASTLNA